MARLEGGKRVQEHDAFVPPRLFLRNADVSPTGKTAVRRQLEQQLLARLCVAQVAAGCGGDLLGRLGYADSRRALRGRGFDLNSQRVDQKGRVAGVRDLPHALRCRLRGGYEVCQIDHSFGQRGEAAVVLCCLFLEEFCWFFGGIGPEHADLQVVWLPLARSIVEVRTLDFFEFGIECRHARASPCRFILRCGVGR